jgi:anti-sigma regulatory factor (Ser/Thr protein kinase)
MKELTLEAKVDHLNEVLAFVGGCLEETDCSPKAQMQIDLCVEEMFINVASYAYGSEKGDVIIRLEEEKDPSGISIVLVDEGMPYDPLAKADPDVTASADQRQIGGLGIFLVKKTMDDIEYEYKDGKNILTIKKSI